MDETECSFCHEIEDSNEVLSIRELMFDDWHGWPKSMTKVVAEILPEVTNPTEICKDCLQAVLNFYQLKRDISVRVSIEEDAASGTSEIKVKDEYGEYDFEPSFTHKAAVGQSSPSEWSTAHQAEDQQQVDRIDSMPLSIRKKACNRLDPIKDAQKIQNIVEDAEKMSFTDVAIKYGVSARTVAHQTKKQQQIDRIDLMPLSIRKKACNRLDPIKDAQKIQNIVEDAGTMSFSDVAIKYGVSARTVGDLVRNIRSAPRIKPKRTRKSNKIRAGTDDGQQSAEPKDEDELLIQTNKSIESEGAVRNMCNELSLTSEEAQSTVLPNDEMRMMKENAEKKRRHVCATYSITQRSKQELIWHLLSQHSFNQELFKSWIRRQIKKSLSFPSKNRPKCCVCLETSRTMSLFRIHLKKHIIQGEVTDAEFLSMKMTDPPGSAVGVPKKSRCQR